MKRVAIVQSNYIPWKGYFDLINRVDEFILYDDMQYTRRDWRNRNKIKTPDGTAWLTIPVEVKGKYLQKINETRINDKNWCRKHWQTLVAYYSKASCFKLYKDLFEELYLTCNEEYLSRINYRFILAINEILGITTSIRWSGEFTLSEGKTEKIIGICKDTNAGIYLSGPAAKEYFDEEIAERENIKVEWMDYSGYPAYSQLYPPFTHNVTVLDLIFNQGPDSKKYMKSFGI